MCKYFYDENKTRQRYVISSKVFKCVLGVIIVIVGVFYLFVNSFKYFSCIQTIQCVIPALYLLFEPLIYIDV